MALPNVNFLFPVVLLSTAAGKYYKEKKTLEGTCLQDDVAALHEALAVDDAVYEDAGHLYLAPLQAHSQTLQGKKESIVIMKYSSTKALMIFC